VAQQLLNRPDVIPGLEQVRRERMPQGVAMRPARFPLRAIVDLQGARQPQLRQARRNRSCLQPRLPSRHHLEEIVIQLVSERFKLKR
jgi:hypothetical protein